MHQPIRDNLEEFLKGSAHKLPGEFYAHLAACEGCAAELRRHEAQAALLRSLQVDGEVEPRPGFYARVVERIERQRTPSIWSILLEPALGRRIAVASAALAVLLGTYLVTTDTAEPEFAATQDVVFTAAPPDSQVSAEQDTIRVQRQRDAVLVNLASYHE